MIFLDKKSIGIYRRFSDETFGHGTFRKGVQLSESGRHRYFRRPGFLFEIRTDEIQEFRKEVAQRNRFARREDETFIRYGRFEV